jgi:hypothetical protein
VIANPDHPARRLHLTSCRPGSALACDLIRGGRPGEHGGGEPSAGDGADEDVAA